MYQCYAFRQTVQALLRRSGASTITTPARKLAQFLTTSLSSIGGVFLLLFLLLYRNEISSDSMNQEISSLYHSTVPQNALNSYPIKTMQSAGNTSAQWKFEMESPWRDCKEWVATNMPEGYEELKRSDSQLQFRKLLLGDTYRMDVRRVNSGPHLQIRVEILALPS